MNPRIVTASGVLALATVVFLTLARHQAEPPAPEPAPSPRSKAPVRRTFVLPHPVAPPPRRPETPETPPEPSVSLSAASRPAYSDAANEALGTGWRDCLTPWQRETGAEGPVVLNLLIEDGRMVDIELVTQLDLDEAVLSCFADAAWSVSYPEDPDHRGRVKLQRVADIKN